MCGRCFKHPYIRFRFDRDRVGRLQYRERHASKHNLPQRVREKQTQQYTKPGASWEIENFISIQIEGNIVRSKMCNRKHNNNCIRFFPLVWEIVKCSQWLHIFAQNKKYNPFILIGMNVLCIWVYVHTCSVKYVSNVKGVNMWRCYFKPVSWPRALEACIVHIYFHVS